MVYSAVFYRLIARRFTDADEAEGELSTVVQENATGVRVVRAFGREKFEMDRFREKNDAFAKLWIKLGTLSGLYWGVGDLITGLQVVTIIVLRRGRGGVWQLFQSENLWHLLLIIQRLYGQFVDWDVFFLI